MGVKIELRVFELLASRVCHDLISPIGAIGNGLELLEEADKDMAADALQLSINCVQRASALLEFFRMAYGAAGADAGLRWEAAKPLAEGLLAGGKSSLTWGPAPANLVLPAGVPKLALNLVLMAAESLPRGGQVAVALEPGTARLTVAASATGRDARVNDEVNAALAAGPDGASTLTAKSVHAFFTARLAESLRGRLEVAVQPGAVRLAAGLPLA